MTSERPVLITEYGKLDRATISQPEFLALMEVLGEIHNLAVMEDTETILDITSALLGIDEKDH